MKINKMEGRAFLCSAALSLALMGAAVMPAFAAPATSHFDAASPATAFIAGDEDDSVAEEGFVGKWTLAGIEAADMDEDTAAMINLMLSMGMSYDAEFLADGTFTLSMTIDESLAALVSSELGDLESQSVEGTWKETGTNKARVTVDGSPLDVYINDDGLLVFDMGGGNVMNFSRGGAAGAKATEFKFVENPQSFEGEWMLVGMDIPGMQMDLGEDAFATLQALGMKGTLKVDDDGKFEITIDYGDVLGATTGMDTITISGTWKETGKLKGVFTAAQDGQTVEMDAAIKDSRLILSQGDEGSIAFAMPVAEAADKAEYAGIWVLSGVEDNGSKNTDSMFSQLGAGTASSAIIINEDGAFEYAIVDSEKNEFSVEGKWAVDEDGYLTLNANGTTEYGFIEDDVLYLIYEEDGEDSDFLVYEAFDL